MEAPDLSDLPNIDPDAFEAPTTANLLPQPPTHPPRILLLYGSLRERSFSRFQAQEAARLLEAFGAETRIFNPRGLPLPDDAPVDHPKVQDEILRKASASFCPGGARPPVQAMNAFIDDHCQSAWERGSDAMLVLRAVRRIAAEPRFSAPVILKIHRFLPEGWNLHRYKPAPNRTKRKMPQVPFCDSIGLKDLQNAKKQAKILLEAIIHIHVATNLKQSLYCRAYELTVGGTDGRHISVPQ